MKNEVICDQSSLQWKVINVCYVYGVLKINWYFIFNKVCCFWIVCIDGIEMDFLYYKCVKVKIVIEYFNFVDSYDVVYRGKLIY